VICQQQGLGWNRNSDKIRLAERERERMGIRRSTLHNLASHLSSEGWDSKAEGIFIIVLDSILQELFELNFDHKYEFDEKVQDLLAQLRTLVVTEDPASMVIGKYKKLHLGKADS
jgi:hypothetical protein